MYVHKFTRKLLQYSTKFLTLNNTYKSNCLKINGLLTETNATLKHSV